MANHFIDDEAKEFFGKFGIELCSFGQRTQPSDLPLLAPRIGRGHPRFRLVASDFLGDLESFGQHENERCVDIVDAFAIPLQCVVVHANPLGLPSFRR